MSKPAAEKETARTVRLARADQVRFAEALSGPPRPNARLARAAKRHSKLIERRPVSLATAVSE